MKILYDYQVFQMQNYGGISNSFVNLIRNLPSDVEYRIGVKDSDNVHLGTSCLAKVSPIRTKHNFLSKRCFSGKGRLYNFIQSFYPSIDSYYKNKHYSQKLLEEGEYDVFHPTYFDDYFLPFLGNKPFVLTVHDMIPELLGLDDRLQIRWKKCLIPLASHIVAVSHKTKQDLMEIMDVPEYRISVIYHGAPETKKAIPIKPVIPNELRYLLFVGRRDIYKGFQTMVESLVPILSKENIHIICTGPNFSIAERQYFLHLGIQDKILHVEPSDSEMIGLYAHALCFIFPSEYEGFGIPILEAYSADCPVVLNHASCFPEIAGDAAVYFHTAADGSTDLYDVMMRFLQISPQEREQLLVRQRLRLQNYSWQKSAQQLSEVYKSLIRRS